MENIGTVLMVGGGLFLAYLLLKNTSPEASNKITINLVNYPETVRLWTVYIFSDTRLQHLSQPVVEEFGEMRYYSEPLTFNLPAEGYVGRPLTLAWMIQEAAFMVSPIKQSIGVGWEAYYGPYDPSFVIDGPGTYEISFSTGTISKVG